MEVHAEATLDPALRLVVRSRTRDTAVLRFCAGWCACLHGRLQARRRSRLCALLRGLHGVQRSSLSGGTSEGQMGTFSAPPVGSRVRAGCDARALRRRVVGQQASDVQGARSEILLLLESRPDPAGLGPWPRLRLRCHGQLVGPKSVPRATRSASVHAHVIVCGGAVAGSEPPGERVVDHPRQAFGVIAWEPVFLGLDRGLRRLSHGLHRPSRPRFCCGLPCRWAFFAQRLQRGGVLLLGVPVRLIRLRRSRTRLCDVRLFRRLPAECQGCGTGCRRDPCSDDSYCPDLHEIPTR